MLPAEDPREKERRERRERRLREETQEDEKSQRDELKEKQAIKVGTYYPVSGLKSTRPGYLFTRVMIKVGSA